MGARTRAELAEVVRTLRDGQSRTWSVIVTFYGDAIVPRGGSAWLGTTLAFFDALGVGGNVVRTAMSRLARDGWVERTRVGRNSFYRLSAEGAAAAARASAHIYAARQPAWDGALDIVLLGPGADREAARAGLRAADYGAFAPDVWLGPMRPDLPALEEGAVRVEARVERAAAARLASQVWDLDRVAASYRALVDLFGPLADAASRDGEIGEADAVVGRVLLIHAYRKVILRDPVLPAEVLPPRWPGVDARALVAELYRRLIPASEAWLDRSGLGVDGLLPPAAPDLALRFRDRDVLQKNP